MLSLANLEFGLGLSPAAASHYLEVLGPNLNGQPEKLVQAAESLGLSGKLEKAVEINQRIAELALVAFSQKQDQEAIELMSQAVDIQATSARVFMLGLAYQRSRNLEKACPFCVRP